MSRNFLIYGCFSLFTSIIGFALTPILSHFLTTEDFGYLGWFTILSQLFVPLISLSMNSIIGRSFHTRNDINALVASAIIAISACTFLFFIGTVFFALFSLLTIPYYLVFLSLFTAYFTVISAVFLTLFQMQEEPITWGKVVIVNTLVSVAVTFLCLFYFRDDYYSRALGLFSGQCCAAIVGFIYIKRNYDLSFCFNLDHIKYFLKIGVPLSIAALSAWALMSVDRILIEKIIGLKDMGEYVFAVTLASPVLILQTTYTRVWGPYAYKLLASNRYQELRKKLYYSIGGYIAVGFLFSVISPYIYYQLVDSTFFPSVILVPLLVIAIVIQGFQNLLLPFITHKQKTKIIGYLGVISISFNLICNYYLINNFGVIGAAITWSLTSLIVAIVYFYYIYNIYARDKNEIN